MKAVLVTDSHLGIYKASDLYHQLTLDLFESIVDTCNRNDIDTIIHLGDWFHNRKHINLKTIDTAFQISDILTDFKVYIITGNHDTFYKHSINPTSLDIYSEYDNIHIIKEPTVLDNITLLPWGEYTEEDIDKIDTDYLFSHLEINDFLMNTHYKFTGGLSPDLFKKFKKVLLGHFHTPSDRGNIRYLGGPYQMNFGDMGDRGYYIFDDGEIEFIEFTGAPKYVKLMSESEMTKDEIEGNIVRLTYEKDYGKTENNNLLEKVKALNPLQLYTDFSKAADVEIMEGDDVSIEKPKESMELLVNYIDILKLDDHIKPDILRKIITNLFEGIE